jgi:hypothetical protein
MKNMLEREDQLEAEAIAQYDEEGKELKACAERLLNNPDFVKIMDYYTKQEVETALMSAVGNADMRPMLFEKVLNRKAFQAFFEELLAI